MTLPARDFYAMPFKGPEPEDPMGGYFDGVNQLEPQRITLKELAARSFVWDIKAPPAFIVP